MAARLEHPACERDRVGDATHGRDGTAVEPVAFHDRGVHLDGALAGQDGASTGIEPRMVLERTHGGLDGVERTAARGEHAPSRSHCCAHAPPQLLASVVRVRTRTAVHDDRRHTGTGGPGRAWRHRIHRVTIAAVCKTGASTL
jgi:hypothetical protein